MAGLRDAIENDTLSDFVEQFYADQQKGDIEELA